MTRRNRSAFVAMSVALTTCAFSSSCPASRNPELHADKTAMAKPMIDENLFAERFDQFLDRTLDTERAVRIFGNVVAKEKNPDIWTVRPNPQNLPGVAAVRFYLEDAGDGTPVLSTLDMDLLTSWRVTTSALSSAFRGPLRALPRGPSPTVKRRVRIERAPNAKQLEGTVGFKLEAGSNQDSEPLSIVGVQFNRVVDDSNDFEQAAPTR